MLNTVKIAALSLSLTGLLVSATYGQIEYSPPALDFGVPDLQGTWSYETRTAHSGPPITANLRLTKRLC